VGTAPSHGLRKGVVVNIDSTVESIKKAIEEAELMAGLEIRSVYVGIAGGHIAGMNSRGVIAISNKGREITRAEVDRVIDAARAVVIPMDREVIHVLPQEFIVDDQDGIKDPIGMCGVRLEAEIHIVTGAVTSAQNIVKSVRRAGYEVNDIVLQPLASANAVLNDDEKELGCVLIDIGGGTSDLVMYVDGAVWHTGVLAIGGSHVTNDLTVGLRTPVQSAEIIKRKHGCALKDLINPAEMIEVPSVGGRGPQRVPRTFLAEVIQPRMEEIFSLVKQEIRMTGFNDLISAGVIITGGASLMEGTVEVAERVFGMPVRIGTPKGIGGLKDVVASPVYATGVGLTQYGMADQGAVLANTRDNGLFRNVRKRMLSWIGEFF
jgi:cell division protein FtsA